MAGSCLLHGRRLVARRSLKNGHSTLASLSCRAHEKRFRIRADGKGILGVVAVMGSPEQTGAHNMTLTTRKSAGITGRLQRRTTDCYDYTHGKVTPHAPVKWT